MKEGEPVLGGPQANPGSTAPSNTFGPQPAGSGSGLPQMPIDNLASQPPAPIYGTSQFSAFSNNSMATPQPNAPTLQPNITTSQPNIPVSQPNTATSFPFSQPQQPSMQPPMQPPIPSTMPSQILTDSQPVILESGKKKHRVAILVTIAVIVLSTITATIVIVLNQKASASFAENVQSLYESLGWFSYTSQCPRLAMELDNIYYSSEEYKAFADDCRNQASNIKDLIGALNGRGNQDFKNIYNILASAVNESIVFGDNLDQEIALYTDWHEFTLNTQPSTPLVYNDDIKDAVAPLINSNNIVLKEFGEQWLQKQLELRFWQANAETFPDNTESQELLSTSELGLQEFIINDTPDIIGMTKIGTVQDNPSLSSALFKLKYYIEENL